MTSGFLCTFEIAKDVKILQASPHRRTEAFNKKAHLTNPKITEMNSIEPTRVVEMLFFP